LIEYLKVGDLQTSGGELNHILLPSLLSSILTNGTNQTIAVRWELDYLSVNRLNLRKGGNTVNGHDLDKAFLSLNSSHPQKLPTSTVGNVVANDVQLDPQQTLINNINYSQWIKNAVMTRANQVLDVPLVLTSLKDVQNLR
jgi:hypothetical protein